MNLHTYALLKSGHLTHPHFLFISTSAAQDQHVKLQNALFAVITTGEISFPLFHGVSIWEQGIYVLPLPLPATLLLSSSLSAPAH